MIFFWKCRVPTLCEVAFLNPAGVHKQKRKKKNNK